jgi:hypothetical protein
MTATFAHSNDALAPIAVLATGACDVKTAPAQPNDERTKPEEEGRPRRDSFLDFLRRALAVPHV